MKHYTRNLYVIAILSLLLVGCNSGEQNTASTPEPEGTQNFGAVISATGVVVPMHWASLSARSQGVINEVLVTEGERVSTGQVLVRLDGQEAAQAKLSQAQQAYDAILRTENGERAKFWNAYMNAQITRAQTEKEWEDLNVESIDDRIAELEGDIEDLRDELKTAQEDFDKYRTLDKDNSKRKTAEDGLETAQEDLNAKVRELEAEIRSRDELKAAYDAALAAEAEAKFQYEISLDGPNADKFAIAKADLDTAQDLLATFTITAPFDGVVCNLDARVGEWVTQSKSLLQLGDLNNLRVETTDLSEIDAARVHPQDMVLITFDALPDVTVQGTVLWVANKSAEGSGVNYTTVIVLDTIPAGLRWGMTAFADIEVSE